MARKTLGIVFCAAVLAFGGCAFSSKRAVETLPESQDMASQPASEDKEKADQAYQEIHPRQGAYTRREHP